VLPGLQDLAIESHNPQLGSELACKTTALIRVFVLLVIKDLSLHVSLKPPLVRINLFLRWLAERN
jgi:hypothetical protein